jgi:hypothetical protein
MPISGTCGNWPIEADAVFSVSVSPPPRIGLVAGPGRMGFLVRMRTLASGVVYRRFPRCAAIGQLSENRHKYRFVRG